MIVSQSQNRYLVLIKYTLYFSTFIGSRQISWTNLRHNYNSVMKTYKHFIIKVDENLKSSFIIYLTQKHKNQNIYI